VWTNGFDSLATPENVELGVLKFGQENEKTGTTSV
jgi:hypothetical protein